MSTVLISTLQKGFVKDGSQEEAEWANSSIRPYLEKKKSQKRAGGVIQGVSPEFKPQYHIRQGVRAEEAGCGGSSL
jgi:hypothetical protein